MTTKTHNPADKVEQWPIEKLIPYAKNSRTHSEEQVAQIAAEKNGRVARIMEFDPKYCDVIVKRWQQFTGKIAIHAETGEPFAEVKDGNEEAQT
jgi:hypothetical protein